MTDTVPADLVSKYQFSNGIKLHYLDYAGHGPTLIMLHGLTANAHEFDGLITAGLCPSYRVLAPDLRGRGRSDKPSTGYSMADHAADVLGLLDALALNQVILVGHSFGGILALFMAARYPERVSRIILIDLSEAAIHPSTAGIIRASLKRLEKVFPSWTVYKSEMQKMPYLDGYWDPVVESYFRADMEINQDGTVQSRARPEIIQQAFDAALDEPWDDNIRRIGQPALLINAPGPYGPPGSPAVIPAIDAQETASKLRHCRYQKVPGNHITMVFGENAPFVVNAITNFLDEM